MEVQTGTAAFGQQGTYGVLTKSDATRLLALAMMGAIVKPEHGVAYRKLLRRMVGFVAAPDLIMLAEIASTATAQQREWDALAVELKERAGL